MPCRRSALLFCSAAVLVARGAAAVCTPGATPLRVPEDCALVSDAVAAIADGGTIDIATNTYAFGASGLDLSGKNRAMTLRARSIGGVIFSGGTTGQVVRMVNGAANGKPIVFEGIRFVNGFSATANRAGGVTLANADATFADCSFEQNRMTEATTGGGALGLYGNSRALVVRSAFVGNSATNDGGAIYAVKANTGISSAVWIHDSTFDGNRSGKAGGAIYLRDGKARVTKSRFESNVADFVAGAIYAFGSWTGSAPYCNFSAASSDVVVSRSHFVSNRADDDEFPGKSVDGHTEGGALHSEDCTRMQIFHSLLEQNEANVGGALSIYRARTDITDTVLRGNRAVYAASGQVPAGGTIAELSSDSSLAGNDYPSAELNISGSLIEGIAGTATAQLGGCLASNGDLARKNAGGTLNSAWRAKLTLTGTALDNCSIAQLDTGSTSVAGGALFAALSNVTLTNVLIANASGDGGASANAIGGGATLSNQTTASFSNLAFSGCTSDGPYPSLRVDATSSTSGSWSAWSATQSSPAGGILLAVPSRVPSGSAPFPGIAYVAFAWSGSSATLDGNALGSPKNGVVQKAEGTHTLAVSGLSNLTATLASPIAPSSTLDATPTTIASGSATTLAWTTPTGTFLTSLIDRGVGEKPASGSATASPLGTSSYRRLAVTREGGSLAERLVTVSGSAPPPSGSIFADGFESGTLAAWSVAVP